MLSFGSRHRLRHGLCRLEVSAGTGYVARVMNEIDRQHSAARCPICRKPMELAFKPFCSKRCADIDLNRWLSGVYAVPVKDDEDEDGERPAEPGEDDKA